MNTRRILLHNQAHRLARFGKTFAGWDPSDVVDGSNVIRTVTPVVIERDGCTLELDEGLVTSVMTLAIEARDWRIHHQVATEHFILCSPTGRTVVYRAPGALLKDAMSPSTRYLRRGTVYQQAKAWASLAAAHGRLHEGGDWDEASHLQRHVEKTLDKLGPTMLDSVWVTRRRRSVASVCPWWARYVREREEGRVFPEVLARLWKRRRLWPMSGDDLVEVLGYMAAWREWKTERPPLVLSA